MKVLHLQAAKNNNHLFVVDVDDFGHVPFKLPSIVRVSQYVASLKLAQSKSEEVQLYECIFRECVVDEDLAYDLEIPAFLPQSIAQLILLLSGVSGNVREYTEGLLDTFRGQSSSHLLIMKRTICSCFNAYTFADLDQMDYQDLVELFVQAEVTLLDVGILETPFSFDNGEKQKKRRNIPPLPPMPPQGPGNMSSVASKVYMNTAASPGNSSDFGDLPVDGSGKIDIDALVKEGQRMARQDAALPSRSAFNLNDDPAYKAKKEAALKKLNRRG